MPTSTPVEILRKLTRLTLSTPLSPVNQNALIEFREALQTKLNRLPLKDIDNKAMHALLQQDVCKHLTTEIIEFLFSTAEGINYFVTSREGELISIQDIFIKAFSNPALELIMTTTLEEREGLPRDVIKEAYQLKCLIEQCDPISAGDLLDANKEFSALTGLLRHLNLGFRQLMAFNGKSTEVCRQAPAERLTRFMDTKDPMAGPVEPEEQYQVDIYSLFIPRKLIKDLKGHSTDYTYLVLAVYELSYWQYCQKIAPGDWHAAQIEQSKERYRQEVAAHAKVISTETIEQLLDNASTEVSLCGKKELLPAEFAKLVRKNFQKALLGHDTSAYIDNFVPEQFHPPQCGLLSKSLDAYQIPAVLFWMENLNLLPAALLYNCIPPDLWIRRPLAQPEDIDALLTQLSIVPTHFHIPERQILGYIAASIRLAQEQASPPSTYNPRFLLSAISARDVDLSILPSLLTTYIQQLQSVVSARWQMHIKRHGRSLGLTPFQPYALQSAPPAASAGDTDDDEKIYLTQLKSFIAFSETLPQNLQALLQETYDEAYNHVEAATRMASATSWTLPTFVHAFHAEFMERLTNKQTGIPIPPIPRFQYYPLLHGKSLYEMCNLYSITLDLLLSENRTSLEDVFEVNNVNLEIYIDLPPEEQEEILASKPILMAPAPRVTNSEEEMFAAMHGFSRS